MSPESLGVSIAGGGGAGLLIGYAAKKAVKIALFLFGGFLAILAYLETQGIISVNWEGINSAVGGVANVSSEAVGTGTQQFTALTGTGAAPVGGGFSLGFLMGFYRG